MSDVLAILSKINVIPTERIDEESQKHLNKLKQHII